MPADGAGFARTAGLNRAGREEPIRMGSKERVLRAIAQILADKGVTRVAIAEDDPIGEGGLGLDSLDMATIVAQLWAELRVDPFARAVPRFHTVGEFANLYEGEPRS